MKAEKGRDEDWWAEVLDPTRKVRLEVAQQQALVRSLTHLLLPMPLLSALFRLYQLACLASALLQVGPPFVSVVFLLAVLLLASPVAVASQLEHHVFLCNLLPSCLDSPLNYNGTVSAFARALRTGGR